MNSSCFLLWGGSWIQRWPTMQWRWYNLAWDTIFCWWRWTVCTATIQGSNTCLVGQRQSGNTRWCVRSNHRRTRRESCITLPTTTRATHNLQHTQAIWKQGSTNAGLVHKWDKNSTYQTLSQDTMHPPMQLWSLSIKPMHYGLTYKHYKIHASLLYTVHARSHLVFEICTQIKKNGEDVR